MKTVRAFAVALCAILPTFVLAADVTPTPAAGGLRLPAIFSDNMVLQAGVPVPVWGWAAPGESVTISVAGQSVTAKADAQGKWKAMLAPLQVADNLTFTAKGASATWTAANVLVGEVWLASGQSNMAMPKSHDDLRAHAQIKIRSDDKNGGRCNGQADDPKHRRRCPACCALREGHSKAGSPRWPLYA